MTRTLLAAALLLSSPAAAAAQATPERSSTVIVYGDDACPKGEGDEVVVCARRPERERYRIPKELRHENEPLSEQSWKSRMEGLEEAGRETMPGGCSVVGSYGQSGCNAALIRQWYAERRARRRGR